MAPGRLTTKTTTITIRTRRTGIRIFPVFSIPWVTPKIMTTAAATRQIANQPRGSAVSDMKELK